MKGIILASHGDLAMGMLETVKIFSGDIQQIEAVSLSPEEELEVFIKKLESAIDRVEMGDGVIVFCDLLFGTPFNMSAKLYANTKYANQIDLITGMNLPLILESTTLRYADIDINSLVEIGKDGILNYGGKIRQELQ